MKNVQYIRLTLQISKVGTDLLGRYCKPYNMKVITTRMFTHTGPRRGDVFSESTFQNRFSMIEERVTRTNNLCWKPTITQNLLQMLEMCKGKYYMLVTKNPIGGEYYNIGGEYTCEIGEMLDYLISQSTTDNITIEVDKDRLRPIDADLQVPDTTKFREHTGWKPEYTFEQTMDDLLDYWRNEIKKGKKFLNR